MKTNQSILLLGGLLFLISGCMNGGMTGNGQVVEEDRGLSGFSSVRVERGVNVYISQGGEESVVARADENLIEYLITEVRDGELLISSRQGVRRPTAWEVEVQVKEVNSIRSGSGSDVSSRGEIRAGELSLHAGSGSDLELELRADTLHAEAGAGSDMELRGKVNKLTIRASSGSDVEAGELISASCEARAGSGSDLLVHATESLRAEARSGADIRYKGSPKQVDKNTSSGGDINAVN